MAWGCMVSVWCSSTRMQWDDGGVAHFSRQLLPRWWHRLAPAANRVGAEVLGRSLRCPLQGVELRHPGYGSGRILSGLWLNLGGYHTGMAQGGVTSSYKPVPGAILPEVTLRSAPKESLGSPQTHPCFNFADPAGEAFSAVSTATSCPKTP